VGLAAETAVEVVTAGAAGMAGAEGMVLPRRAAARKHHRPKSRNSPKKSASRTP